MLVDVRRHATYLAAYDLFEAVQGERHAAAVAALPAALRTAEDRGWPEVAFVLAAASTVHAVARPVDEALTAAAVTALVERAQDLGAPALLAVALGLRAVAASGAEGTVGLMGDASRAVALLDDETQPALDRCTGYVVAAAAFNSLRLWELVDELYGRASDLGPQCEVPAQSAAIAVNRVLTRLEWATALVESGEEAHAQLRLAQTLAAVPAALAQTLPALWRSDVEACAVIVDLLRGRDVASVLPSLDLHRRALAAGGDIEVLPLLDAAVALALWRDGQEPAALAAAARLTPVRSASSGACSFPLWVRALVLSGSDTSSAARAQRDHAATLGRLRWESRQAVLAAARAYIAAERRQGEHDRLTHAVNTDPLTGLHNRRTFDSWLHQPSPTQHPTALLLVDVDDFKQVNDIHGHDRGDAVLRRFGQLLLACVRPGDLAVRHGGDEFAVLIDDAQLSLPAARQRASDLHAAITAEPWADISPGLVVTASIGMAFADPRSEDAEVSAAVPTMLYRAADAALYAAKRDVSGLATAPGHQRGRPGPARHLPRESMTPAATTG